MFPRTNLFASVKFDFQIYFFFTLIDGSGLNFKFQCYNDYKIIICLIITLESKTAFERFFFHYIRDS